MVAIHTDRMNFLNREQRKLKIGNFGAYDSVYKFVSLRNKTSWNRLEQTLDTSELIGATINSLNDPFEGKPRIFNDINEELFAECCKYFDKNGILRTIIEEKSCIEFDEIEDHLNGMRDATEDAARIIAFTRRIDSHLLWSHYADSHYGACLHFNLSAFVGEKIDIGPVQYTNARPVLPMSLMAKLALPPKSDHHPEDRNRLRSELFKILFFTKPLDWAYEEEIRVIYLNSDMTNLKFQKSGLFEIVLGARCSEEDKKRVVDLVKKFAPRVLVRQARISDTTFGVVVE